MRLLLFLGISVTAVPYHSHLDCCYLWESLSRQLLIILISIIVISGNLCRGSSLSFSSRLLLYLGISVTIVVIYGNLCHVSSLSFSSRLLLFLGISVAAVPYHSHLDCCYIWESLSRQFLIILISIVVISGNLCHGSSYHSHLDCCYFLESLSRQLLIILISIVVISGNLCHGSPLSFLSRLLLFLALSFSSRLLLFLGISVTAVPSHSHLDCCYFLESLSRQFLIILISIVALSGNLCHDSSLSFSSRLLLFLGISITAVPYHSHLDYWYFWESLSCSSLSFSSRLLFCHGSSLSFSSRLLLFLGVSVTAVLIILISIVVISGNLCHGSSISFSSRFLGIFVTAVSYHSHLDFWESLSRQFFINLISIVVVSVNLCHDSSLSISSRLLLFLGISVTAVPYHFHLDCCYFWESLSRQFLINLISIVVISGNLCHGSSLSISSRLLLFLGISVTEDPYHSHLDCCYFWESLSRQFFIILISIVALSGNRCHGSS